MQIAGAFSEMELQNICLITTLFLRMLVCWKEDGLKSYIYITNESMCHSNVIYVIVDEIIQIKLLIAINTITIEVFCTMKCTYLVWSTIFGHFSSFRCRIVNMNFRKINIGGYNKFLEMNGHNFILLLIYKLFWQTNILIIKVQFNHYMHYSYTIQYNSINTGMQKH